jgi:hypothetical protein
MTQLFYQEQNKCYWKHVYSRLQATYWNFKNAAISAMTYHKAKKGFFIFNLF